ncbi:MAG: SpoIIIAH-like family protein [Oscillospiraceae bacterium]|nr:SpoIIIAH-like family protein [Oscillospiraceae bacterium]
MKKPSFIIGKKQIILTCMTLMLGIAVYVNYALTENEVPVKKSVSVNADISSSDSTVESTAENNTTTENEDSIDVDTENYGESEFVNGETSADFFAQARLEKMTNRDEAVQTLQTIMGGGDITEDEMVTNALEAVEVSKLIESEGKIESLIKAQGIEDCVVYLDGKSAKVVVKTQGLDKAQAATIKDIILGEVTVPAENIRVFEVK